MFVQPLARTFASTLWIYELFRRWGNVASGMEHNSAGALLKRGIDIFDDGKAIVVEDRGRTKASNEMDISGGAHGDGAEASGFRSLASVTTHRATAPNE